MALEGGFDENLLSVGRCKGIVGFTKADSDTPVSESVAPYDIMLLRDDGRASDATSTSDEPVKYLDARGMSASTKQIHQFLMLTTVINSSGNKTVQIPLYARSATSPACVDVRHAILCYINSFALKLVNDGQDAHALILFPVIVGEMVEYGVGTHAERVHVFSELLFKAEHAP